MSETIWFGAISLSAFLIWWRFRDVLKKKSTSPGSVAQGGGAAPSLTEGVFTDTLLNGFVWARSFLLVCGAALVSPSVTPNWTWIPFGAWAVVVFVTRARDYSKERSPGKDKRPDPGLEKLSMRAKGFALFATVVVIAYYAIFASDGTWGKVTSTGRSTPYGPSELIMLEGLPPAPNFPSTMLATFDVIYVASNPQYGPERHRFSNKKLILLEKPGRYVTDRVDLTASFGAGYEDLDLQIGGAPGLTSRCETDEERQRRPQPSSISKICSGSWKDRGNQRSGQFYLQVTEGGSGRDFVIYLYPGNALPRESALAMALYGPPIPAMMLQFLPKGSKENQ